MQSRLRGQSWVWFCCSLHVANVFVRAVVVPKTRDLLPFTGFLASSSASSLILQCTISHAPPPPLSLSVSLHETGFSLSRMSRIIRGIGIFLCSIKPKRSSSSSCASCWVLQRMCCGTVHSQQGVQNGSLRCGRCNPGSCTKRNRLNPYCLLQACQCASHTATLP